MTDHTLSEWCLCPLPCDCSLVLILWVPVFFVSIASSDGQKLLLNHCQDGSYCFIFYKPHSVLLVCWKIRISPSIYFISCHSLGTGTSFFLTQHLTCFSSFSILKRHRKTKNLYKEKIKTSIHLHFTSCQIVIV